MVLVHSSGLRCNLKEDSKYAISGTELVWVLNISESYADICTEGLRKHTDFSYHYICSKRYMYRLLVKI